MSKRTKRLKKQIKKRGREAQKYGARVLSVSAPVLGAVVAGPLGAVAGTAIGAAASRYGGAAGARLKGKKGVSARKRGRSEMKRALATGGAVTALTGAATAAGGGGFFTPVWQSIKGIFGGGGAAPVAPADGGQIAVDPAPVHWMPKDLLERPGQHAAQGGILSDVLDTASRLLGGGEPTDGTKRRTDGGEDEEGGGLGGFLARIPKIVWIGGAVVIGGVILLSAAPRRKAA